MTIHTIYHGYQPRDNRSEPVRPPEGDSGVSQRRESPTEYVDRMLSRDWLFLEVVFKTEPPA